MGENCRVPWKSIFLNKIKADLSARTSSTCAYEVSRELFSPAFSAHQGMTTLSTWSTAAAEVRLLKRSSWARDWEIKWKRAFWMKGVKTSLLVCHVCGVVPASLHIHLSFLPVRCLSQPLPTSFCRASNSNRRPPLLTAAEHSLLSTSCFLSSLLSSRTHNANVPYVFCVLHSAPTFSPNLR